MQGITPAEAVWGPYLVFVCLGVWMFGLVRPGFIVGLGCLGVWGCLGGLGMYLWGCVDSFPPACIHMHTHANATYMAMARRMRPVPQSKLACSRLNLYPSGLFCLKSYLRFFVIGIISALFLIGLDCGGCGC